MARIKRDYEKDYVSVTECLSILRKPALEYYFKYNTPEFIKEDSEKAKAIGVLIHDLIMQNINKEKIEFETEHEIEVMNVLNSFFLFKKENPNIILEKSELKLCSEIYKYVGTLDAIGTENNIPILIDWKTSKCNVGKKTESEKPAIYEDYYYQVSAYVHAYNEQFNASINQSRIISFAKDKIAYNTILLNEQELTEYFSEVFLPLLKVKYFQIKHKGDKK